MDLAFAGVVSSTVTAQLGEIRLAWWRERLEELDKGADPPAEPRLQAVAAHLLPAGVRGVELSRLEDCWFALLSPFPWDDLVADALAQRGRLLFGIGARLLGRKSTEGEPFGVIWSLVDGARHCSDARSRVFLLERAKLAIAELPRKRIPMELQPLAMITARRVYDLLHGDRRGWHRVLWALRAMIFGIMPRS